MRFVALTGTLMFFLYLPMEQVIAAPSDTLIPRGSVSGCDFFAGFKTAIDSGQGFKCILVFLGNFAKFILGFTGTICLILVMIGGYQIAIGSVVGDKEQGKNRVIWALVGLVVCILAYAIVNFVVDILL